MTFNSTLLTISDTELYIHKDANVISKKAQEISENLGIIDEKLYSGHSTMTNYIYIDSPIDKMVNVLVTYDVLYFLDDFFGEDTNTGELPEVKEILEIWKGEKMYHSKNQKINKLYTSINYISRILRKDSPEKFFNKYTNSVIEHLSASLIEKKYNTVDEYISIRLSTGGMYLLIDLIEYVHSIYLNEELINNKNIYIKKLCRQCALIGALSNDIFSYAKEKHSNYNLINAYLISKEASNYKQAIIKAIDKVNDIHSDFKLTIKEVKVVPLAPQDKLTVDKYLNALEVIVASSYHWQKSTDRYYHSENVFEDMKVNVY
ncbi:hypothetical protein EI427_19435 [Flammeovirga pectinis]|uniref:Terpene synthase n=1 Tax=Flammeovirga pectinis TaxID=2494373 RepID=A0A3S9P826_9BACT|nr:terpene synthase family protein [Flammeovirga pectinis]AZQ64304.1 hypothetical protein EI427_19435 [Flammeovirga pectinis]